jgi:hypothetical protein
LKDQSTRWILGDEGLYSFALERNKTFLTKQSLDGKYKEWNVDLPLKNTAANDLLVSECSSIVYVIANGSVLILSASDGKLISRWIINPNVTTIKCSSDSIFILYQNAKVVQYSPKGTYIFTYQVDNKKIVPKYNQMLIIDGLLNYVLCDQDFHASNCVNPIVYKWRIITSAMIPNAIYSRGTKRMGEIKLNNESGKLSFRMSNLSNPNNINFDQNSHLNIASYLRKNNLFVTFFSGGGNIFELECPDMTFYTLKIDTSIVDNLIIVSMTSVPMISDISHSVSDYASIVLDINGEPYFLIHGGISCDYQEIYSDLFAIRMLEYQYFSLKQNKSIP